MYYALMRACMLRSIGKKSRVLALNNNMRIYVQLYVYMRVYVSVHTSVYVNVLGHSFEFIYTYTYIHLAH